MKITKKKYWYTIKALIPKPFLEPLLNLFYYIQSIGYNGNNYYCPICESKLRKFKGQSCPFCGAGIRHRTMWLFLNRKTNFFESQLNVLHFAPEHCYFIKMKNQHGSKYLSADLGNPRAMVKVDMTNIQYPDNTFDVILSSHVLEHVDNDIKAMQELYRVQKSDGWSINLVPIDYSRTETYENPLITSPVEREKVFGHHDHRRIYGKDYKKRLESIGFKVNVFYTEDFCNETEIEKMGLKRDTEIYFCIK